MSIYSLNPGNPPDLCIAYPNASNLTLHLKPIPPVTDTLVYWIKVAQVQGSTYEKLFSPAAFLKSDEERARICVDLVNQLDQAWTARGEVRRPALQHSDTFSKLIVP